MGVKKSVFASNAERANFEKLRRQWGDRYDLWHNIPFLNVFEREPLFDFDTFPPNRITISDIDYQRLKKTSIDYVLCERGTCKPLICIEFDGMKLCAFGTSVGASPSQRLGWRGDHPAQAHTSHR